MAVVLYLICFKNTREVVPRSTTKVSLKKTWLMVKDNRPLIVLCLGAFFLLAAILTMNAVGMYYARYVLGNAGWYTLLMLAQTVGTVIVASFVPQITVRFGKRNGYVGGWVGGAVIGAFGYVAAAPEQTEQAAHGIRLATGIVPALLAIAALVVMLKYPWDAKELNVPFHDQAFTSHDLAKVDRTALLSDSAFDRWLRNMSYSATQDATLSAAIDTSENHAMALQGRRQVLSDVEDGGVVLGRNGALILGKAVGVLHVRLVSPLSKRVERVAQRLDLSPAAAIEAVHTEDRLRSEISKRLYQWDPNDEEAYDLVINTGSVTYDEVVAMIAGMYRAKYPARAAEAEQSDDVGFDNAPATGE